MIQLGGYVKIQVQAGETGENPTPRYQKAETRSGMA